MGLSTCSSDAAEDCSLFVEQARWIAADGTIKVVPGLGFLLTKCSNIRSISFLDEPLEDPPAEVEVANGAAEPIASEAPSSPILGQ